MFFYFVDKLYFKLTVLSVVFFISLLWIPPSAVSQEKLTGYWIARQVFDRDRGRDSVSTATMVLINKKNKKRSRNFINTRILKNGLEKQIIRFTSPADINGTGFLTIEKEGLETDQFLYLPALRRSRRIVSSQKSHRFVNSDFSYEDMERHLVDNYKYELKGEKTKGDIECYLLETRSKDGVMSHYSLTKSLIAKSSFVPIFVEYYDQKGHHIKSYEVIKLELIQGIWTESIVMMADLKKNHKTYIKLQHIEYNTDITPEQVSKSSLENY